MLKSKIIQHVFLIAARKLMVTLFIFLLFLRMSTTIGLTFFCNPLHYGSPHTHYRITNLSLYSDFLFFFLCDPRKKIPRRSFHRCVPGVVTKTKLIQYHACNFFLKNACPGHPIRRELEDSNVSLQQMALVKVNGL